MEVRQLNTLIRAAQFQSFSKAAESLGYSQSGRYRADQSAGRRAGCAPVRPHGQAGDPDRTGSVLSGIRQQHSGYHPQRPPRPERGCRAGGLPAHRHAGISLLFPSARPDASVPGGTPQSQPSGHYRLPGRADRKRWSAARWTSSAFWTSRATPTAGTSATRCRKRWCSWLPRTSASATPARTG